MQAPFSEEDARSAIRRSRSWADALRALGYRPVGNNFRTLKKYAALWGISTDHFRRRSRRRKIPLEEVMVEGSSYSRGNLKNRLYREGLKPRVCELCGQDENWKGGRMSLILDHINGVGNDHRLENLRIVCPNCAATLDTHCGRNVPRSRNCATCGVAFEPKYLQHRHCSVKCGSGGARPHRHAPRPETRKVHRPTYLNLLLDIEEFGYSGTARRYGVSDNAIRKWVNSYQRELDLGDISIV